MCPDDFEAFEAESKAAFEQYEEKFYQAAEAMTSSDPKTSAEGFGALMGALAGILGAGEEEGFPTHFFTTPTRETFEPVQGGEGTTEPFLMVLTDRKWPYNNAYVSTDASLLHYLENGQDPCDLDGRLMEAEALIDSGEYFATPADGPADSQAEWWAHVSAASKDIPQSRHFEGIYY